VEKINAALWDLSAREAWPFLETSIDLTFNGTDPFPSNAPADLQAVLDIVRLDTGTKLQPLRLQEADEAMSLLMTQGGTPYYYYFIASQLRVAQIPVSTMTMRMRYTRRQPKVVQTDGEAAILLPVEHHEALLLGTLVKLYDLEDDTDLSVRFQQLYEKGIQDMRSSIFMRQYDRPDHIQIVDRYDDFYD